MNAEQIPGFEFEEGLYAPPVDVQRLGAAFPVTLGRRSSNDLVLHHGSVSGAHARLEMVEEGGEQVLYIQDVGSTNGTRVDGEPVTRKRLSNGDLVQLGDVGLRFGLLPFDWWEESRRNYLATALPWPLAAPFFHSQVAFDTGKQVDQLYRLCEEMTRLVVGAGAAVAAANGGADAALRWALNRLRNPSPPDWVGAVQAVVRAGSHRGWLEHLPGLISSAAGDAPGTEGAWDALTQWVRTATPAQEDADPNTQAAVLEVLRPTVTELLLSWTFLHEGRLIWVERKKWDFNVRVAHGIGEAMLIEGVRFQGQIPGERVPYWILSAAGGAACLAPWYRVGEGETPVGSWERCPDDRVPVYRAADSGEVIEFPPDEVMPMGAEGAYQWDGFRNYLAADRSLGAVVDLQMSPEDWARILGVSGDKPEGF
jgi:hypothetical protein